MFVGACVFGCVLVCTFSVDTSHSATYFAQYLGVPQWCGDAACIVSGCTVVLSVRRDCTGSVCGCGRQYGDDMESLFKTSKHERRRKSCAVCASVCRRADCSRNNKRGKCVRCGGLCLHIVVNDGMFFFLREILRWCLFVKVCVSMVTTITSETVQTEVCFQRQILNEVCLLHFSEY